MLYEVITHDLHPYFPCLSGLGDAMDRSTILIVDDDRLLQNALNNILGEQYRTLIAGSGEEALQLLEHNTVDLVLLDIRLPGMDGLEALQQIKAREQGLLVIMMTAYEDIQRNNFV